MFLLIDNFDSFTFNLVQEFQKINHDPVVIRNDREKILELADSGKLSRVCISPGPGTPDSAGFCLEFLKRLSPEVPVLGVCLGHQTLGQFAGATIAKAPLAMHGKTSDVKHESSNIFQNLPRPFSVCRYHSLVIQPDTVADSKLEVTARTEEGDIMGIAYKDRPWYGVQFHPESILTPDGPQLLKNFMNVKA
ncbi:MAG: anthranilate synthase component II [Desulfovibrio sp.]